MKKGRGSSETTVMVDTEHVNVKKKILGPKILEQTRHRRTMRLSDWAPALTKVRHASGLRELHVVNIQWKDFYFIINLEKEKTTKSKRLMS